MLTRRPAWGGGIGAVMAALVLVVVLATGRSSSQEEAAPSPPTTTTTSTTTVTATVTPTPQSSTPGPPVSGSPAVVLDALAVKGRAPKTGYRRDAFGKRWNDDVDVESGHNGCDTRNDILRRDLVDVVTRPGTRDCVVASGTLHDVYTGVTVAFVRGQGTSEQVQIDHLVSLSDAWQTGAQQLSAQDRARLANDPRNLQAVAARGNQSKGDHDAASWLPPNKAYRCTFVSRQIAVKAAYRLWVTQAEKGAMARVLASCPAEKPSVPPRLG
ncbi:HNH endonuclease family protein [Gordonia sp. (in: high G+C Gram-positive bacteria)]|uniref:HNH endonuclease family protein n=1 Tax=Gordonia sp. (in: high G+C Gram-positive bacteria) TaxID=84139 RepID=UPI0039E34477